MAPAMRTPTIRDKKFTLYFEATYDATPDQVKELTKYLGWTS